MNFFSSNILLPGKHCILKALLYYEKILLFSKNCNIYWKKTPFGQFLLFIFISSTTLTCKSQEHSHLKSWPEPLDGSAVSGADDVHAEWVWESKTELFASSNAVVFSYCCMQIDTPLSPLFRADFPVVISSWFCHWQWSFPLRLPEASIEGHVPTHTSEFTNELDFTCWCSDISAEVEGYE